MNSTKDILDRHLKCFGAGDLQGIVADYAPDAILFTPTGSLRGRNEIKLLFTALFAEFAKPGASFTMKRQASEGDYAYLVWSAATADHIYEDCSDFFVMKGGQIAAHAFGGKVTAK